MSKLLIKPERCKACGLCVANCPKKCLSFTDSLNVLGYTPVKVDESVCVLCGSCYTMCPDGVYEVQG